MLQFKSIQAFSVPKMSSTRLCEYGMGARAVNITVVSASPLRRAASMANAGQASSSNAAPTWRNSEWSSAPLWSAALSLSAAPVQAVTQRPRSLPHATSAQTQNAPCALAPQ